MRVDDMKDVVPHGACLIDGEWCACFSLGDIGFSAELIEIAGQWYVNGAEVVAGYVHAKYPGDEHKTKRTVLAHELLAELEDALGPGLFVREH